MIGHYDPEITKEYRKSGRFLDRGSKVYVRKDGSLRIRLAGRDKSNLRLACFEKDGWQCVEEGNSPCKGNLEMSHEPAISDPEGSDEISKVFTRCHFHHTEFDHHGVKWSKK